MNPIQTRTIISSTGELAIKVPTEIPPGTPVLVLILPPPTSNPVDACYGTLGTGRRTNDLLAELRGEL